MNGVIASGETDASLILSIYSAMATGGSLSGYTNSQIYLADVNGDSVVNSLDVALYSTLY